MSWKTRGNYAVLFCTRLCTNRHIKCSTCIRFSNFIEDIKATKEKKLDKDEQTTK